MAKVVITFDTEEKKATCLIDGEMLDDFCGAYISCSEEGPGYIELMAMSEDEETDLHIQKRITAKLKN